MGRRKNLIFFLFTGFLFTFPESALPERIDGPANVREAPNGKILFSLNDWAFVNILEQKGDWYKIGWKGTLLPERVENSFIKAGVPLSFKKNSGGWGKTTKRVKIKSFEVTKGNFLEVKIEGYTHKNNLKWVMVHFPDGVEMTPGRYKIEDLVDTKTKTFKELYADPDKRGILGATAEIKEGWYSIVVYNKYEGAGHVKFRKNGMVLNSDPDYSIKNIRVINSRMFKLNFYDKEYTFISIKDLQKIE